MTEKRARTASRLTFGALLAATVVAACGPTAPRTPSAPPAVLGMDWGRATSVERPANYEQSVPPDYPGTHPILRISGQAYMVDVVAAPSGGFVAIGYVPPDWTPAAWTSPDGQAWTFHSTGTTPFTFPVSLAVGTTGTLVAVGRSGNLPIAWTSADGVSWQEHPVPILGSSAVAERVTTIAAGDRGFVAGGSVGPELADRHARFWTSPDGVVWTPAPDDRRAFADAEVRSITPFNRGYVAVGVVGTAQRAMAAVAWTSPDGRTWTRVDDPSFAGDVAASVVHAPFGGLVAVGNDADRREAISWTSADGRRWTKAPTEPSRLHSGGFIWMTDAAAIGDEVIAIGDFQGLQRGTATSWLSTDGLTWQRANRAPVQEQGEFYAITPGGPGAVVVGSFGAPDSYIPEVWLTPAR